MPSHQSIDHATLNTALEPGIIACTAGIWSGSDQYCLTPKVAAGVIRASGSRVLVAHTPARAEIAAYGDQVSDLSEVISSLGVPLSKFVLFFNTSLSLSLDDVFRAFESMEILREKEFYAQAAASYLKLELLGGDLRPLNIETLEILNKISLDRRRRCIPYLTPDLSSVKNAASSGCPCIRIWCSDIGKGQGIKDRATLETIARSLNIPLILEGGIRRPEDAQIALQIGFRAILANSAFRFSDDPTALAEAFKHAIDSVRCRSDVAN